MELEIDPSGIAITDTTTNTNNVAIDSSNIDISGTHKITLNDTNGISINNLTLQPTNTLGSATNITIDELSHLSGVSSNIQTQFNLLKGDAPAALDTIAELADAIGDNVNFVTDINTNIAAKVGKTGDETINGIKTIQGSLNFDTTGTISGDIIPVNNNLTNIGSASKQINAIHANDVNVSGDIHMNGNIDICGGNFTITNEELSKLDGVSDNIQSQINTAIAGNVWDNIGVKIHYNSGNVGIGTNDPTGKLEVHDGPIIVKPGTNATNALQFHSGSGNANYTNDIAWYDSNGAKKVMIGSSSNDNTGHFRFWENMSQDFTFINDASNTKVGINRVDPQYNLDVSGDINLTGNLYQNGSLFSSGGGSSVWSSSNNLATYYNLKVGNIGYGTDYPGIANTNHATTTGYGMIFKANGTTFINAATGQELIFRIGNADKMRIKSDGKVGIGTTAPESMLQLGSLAQNSEATTFDGLQYKKLGLTSPYHNAGFYFATRDPTSNDACLDIGYNHNSNNSLDKPNIMTINDDGNVGIGTPYPHTKCVISHTPPTAIQNISDFHLQIGNNEHGTGTYRLIGFGFIYNETNNSPPAYMGFHTQDNGAGTYGDLVFGTRNTTNKTTVPTERMRIRSNGNVGIGTNNPSCPLEVNGYSSPSVSGHGFLWGFGDIYARTDWSSTNGGTEAAKISIEAEYSIKCKFSVISSDIRIKKDFEDVNDDEALNIVNSLEICKYNYKEPERNNELKTIGFKAQQVKEVLPNAVKIKTDIVPDIMLNVIDPIWEEIVDLSGNNKDIIDLSGNNEDISDLSGNNKYKLIYEIDLSGNEYTGNVQFIVLDGEKEQKKIVKYEDGGFVFEKQYDKLICIGREVNDFHLLNKDIIFGVGMSAIQELSKKNDALNAEKETMQTQITTLLEENNSMKSRLEALEAAIINLQNN